MPIKMLANEINHNKIYWCQLDLTSSRPKGFLDPVYAPISVNKCWNKARNDAGMSMFFGDVQNSDAMVWLTLEDWMRIWWEKFYH
jgi:hypothetical protein